MRQIRPRFWSGLTIDRAPPRGGSAVFVSRCLVLVLVALGLRALSLISAPGTRASRWPQCMLVGRRPGANSHVGPVSFPSLAKINNGKSAVCTISQSLAFSIPSEARLEILIFAVGTRAEPTGMGRTAPDGSGDGVITKLPDEDLIARGAGDKGAIGRHGEGEDRLVHGHGVFRLVLGVPHVPDADGIVVAGRGQKPLIIGWIGLERLPLKCGYHPKVGVDGSTLACLIPQLQDRMC